MKHFFLILVLWVIPMGLYAQDDSVCVETPAEMFATEVHDMIALEKMQKKYRRQHKWLKAGGWVLLSATTLYVAGCIWHEQVGPNMGSYMTGSSASSVWTTLGSSYCYLPACCGLAVSTYCFASSHRKKRKWKRATAQMSVVSLPSLQPDFGMRQMPALSLSVTM